MPDDAIVIVGGGLAGAKGAEAAREAGFDGPVTLVGEEAHVPYERPALSKAVLRGEDAPETTAVHPDGFYAEHDIELVTGAAAVALDLAGRTVELADGRRVPYTRLLLATGAAPRHLAVPGADLAGVHHLRTVDDAVALRDALTRAERVVVVGAGWIGSEVAASARQLGRDVVLVDPGPVPLRRVLGGQIGGVFARLHTDHGVDLRSGTGVVEIRGAGRVEDVVLTNGERVVADLVVAGIGVVSRTELAEAAGIPADAGGGIPVDELLETSVPGVFAAGDVAAAHHRRYGRRLRVEHWANALNQGAAAGRNLAGAGEAYTRLPYFYTDQYDLGMEYVGHADGTDEVIVRGDPADRKFVAFWLHDERVAAAMHVNVWGVVDDLKAIVEADGPADRRRLGDEAVPLGELAT